MKTNYKESKIKVLIAFVMLFITMPSTVGISVAIIETKATQYVVKEHVHIVSALDKVKHDVPSPISNTTTKTVQSKANVVSNTIIDTNKHSNYTKDEVMLLARLIHCEAGVDNYKGKLAVGTVVMNRVINKNKKMFGGPTIKGVIYHKLGRSKTYQFSCLHNKRLWNEELNDDDMRAAKEVLEGHRSFNSSIVYYWNPSICNGIKNVTTVLTVGMHTFAKD